MITRFSRENERLANQNEQLSGSKEVVANDYKGEPFVRQIDHHIVCHVLACQACVASYGVLVHYLHAR